MRSIGYFASSGSRVQVPNIVDLSTSAASSALSAVGLVLGSSTGSISSGATSENNGKVATQSVASGSYVDYGTTITYTTYSYSPPSCTPGWQFTSYGAWSDWSTCSGGTQSRSRAVNGYYLYSDCSTGSVQQYDTQTEYQSCSSCTVGGPCSIPYSCATVGCSFCCPDPCYKAGTYDSSCQCVNPVGSYFC